MTGMSKLLPVLWSVIVTYSLEAASFALLASVLIPTPSVYVIFPGVFALRGPIIDATSILLVSIRFKSKLAKVSTLLLLDRPLYARQ